MNDRRKLHESAAELATVQLSAANALKGYVH